MERVHYNKVLVGNLYFPVCPSVMHFAFIKSKSGLFGITDFTHYVYAKSYITVCSKHRRPNRFGGNITRRLLCTLTSQGKNTKALYLM